MKTSKCRTLWIITLSIAYTAYTCFCAILKRYTGTISRTWVDQMALWHSKKVLGLAKVDCHVYNPEDVEPEKNKPTIIMCNHTSLYDIPLSYQVFPHHSMRMLAKKELSKIPIMGGGMRAAEFPFIDRKNRNQAIKDLEQVRRLLESGIVMWISPEGTRSKDGTLAAFKRGGFITAIGAKATIIPIGIRGAHQILPARTMQLNLNQIAEIHVGKPIDASQYTLENKEALIEAVHQAMTILVGETQQS